MSPEGERGGHMPDEFRKPEEEKKEEGIPQFPANEVHFTFARSSGPGGQNVNKVSSKAVARWSVGNSQAYSPEQKDLIRANAGSRLNKEDELVLAVDDERSQHQNRALAETRLAEMVAEALTPKKERKATKVSRSQKERRLDDKKREGKKKQDRKSEKGEW